jgi:S-(hydroxymethyl)glutathione dehydrogenase/alcohol dehydrogenase
MPKTMRAAVLVAQRQALVVTDIGLPATLDVGQVLVKVHFSGICGSQLGEIDGVKGDDPFLPHLLGHEGSGTVMAVGPGVRALARGDAVVMHWQKGRGIESLPPTYTWNGRPLNAGWVTTFNEYAIVSENRLTPVPAGIELDAAALFGCAVTTGAGVVVNDANVRIGESVAVYGAGGVGLMIVQAAAMVTARPIIAIDRYDSRLSLAGQLGATHAINTAREDARARIQEIAGARGLDVFVDNTGEPAVIELGYAVTGRAGRVTLVGVPRRDSQVSIHSLPLHFGKVLAGSHGGGASPDQDIPRYAALAVAGQLRLREMITDVVELDGINDAIARLRDGSVAGRCLVRMPDGHA